jgi:hypothetical protein
MERFILQYPAITDLRKEYDEVEEYLRSQRVFDKPPSSAGPELRRMYDEWLVKWESNQAHVARMRNLVEANEKVIFVMSAFGQLAPFTRFCAPKFGAGETLIHFEAGAGEYGGGKVGVKYLMNFTDGTSALANESMYDDVQQRIIELLLGTSSLSGGTLGSDGLTHYQ